MTVNREQADMLAALAVAMRPYGAPRWDAPGVVSAVGKVKELQLADVVMAVARAASDAKLQTPAPIGITTSPCWKERVAEPLRPRGPRPDACCRRCGQEFSETCCDAPTRKPVASDRESTARTVAELKRLAGFSPVSGRAVCTVETETHEGEEVQG